MLQHSVSLMFPGNRQPLTSVLSLEWEPAILISRSSACSLPVCSHHSTHYPIYSFSSKPSLQSFTPIPCPAPCVTNSSSFSTPCYLTLSFPCWLAPSLTPLHCLSLILPASLLLTLVMFYSFSHTSLLSWLAHIFNPLVFLSLPPVAEFVPLFITFFLK